MTSILKFLIYILALGGIFYYFRGVILPAKPCAEPMLYVLGDFDERFDISQKYFLDAVKDAEAVWEKAHGGELFAPMPPNGEKPEEAMEINLVYDYRQQATEKLAELGIAVENTKNSYDKLRARFESQKAVYERESESYEARVIAFNDRQKKYNADVKKWNERGGAPEAEYQKLEAERAALETLAAELDRERTALNRQAEEINALVVTLNRLARTLNLSVDRYNTVSISRGESFEDGLYTESGSEKEINIYEFGDRQELVRVLAHELGHALTIGHVDDPKAIMYEYNQGENLTLAPADLAALRAVCSTDGQ
jgi:hypothetical protein